MGSNNDLYNRLLDTSDGSLRDLPRGKVFLLGFELHMAVEVMGTMAEKPGYQTQSLPVHEDNLKRLEMAADHYGLTTSWEPNVDDLGRLTISKAAADAA